jgi:tRNA pseudouridine55 synthase
MTAEESRRMTGLLNINKPAGITSRRVVDRVQRLVRPAKAGHAGTLDPLATGVVVVCVGNATRLIEYVQRMHKSYRATFLLGRTSETEDVEGDVVMLENAPEPSETDIRESIQNLTGEIMQRPPAFSALKVKGQRAYKLARAGQDVQLEPRPTTIYQFRVVSYAYPELIVEIECSRGTYVRSLGRDLAESLGTGAVMSALIRTAVGDFHVDDALELDTLSRDSLAEQLLSPSTAVAQLPRVELNPQQLQYVRHGRAFAAEFAQPESEIAAMDAAGCLVAILQPAGAGQLKPLRVFL